MMDILWLEFATPSVLDVFVTEYPLTTAGLRRFDGAQVADKNGECWEQGRDVHGGGAGEGAEGRRLTRPLLTNLNLFKDQISLFGTTHDLPNWVT